ncbi:rhamnan synthesis F family protein [Niveispirillum fermenti]|uniref:rhamnan synthesis F family protein n=1 Tax=Niveispirillum fermenti TaxID=1233113 RepID=UPI003A8B152C
MKTIKYIERLWGGVRNVVDFGITYAIKPTGPSYIRRKWTGEQALEGARRVVVFNHFDPKGLIHRYVVHYLEELAKAGFTTIFTSNSPRFPTESVEKLIPLTARILWRSNVGYDFGAFKDGIAQVPDLLALDMLLITNDSMYGPLQDLSGIIDRMPAAGADIWGITDCWDRRFHLQSYFLLFHPAALRHASFKRFWGRLPYFRRKYWVVRAGEIGLTQYFQRHGVRARALFPYRGTVRDITGRIETYLARPDSADDKVRWQYLSRMSQCLRDGVPLNQTHFFWDYLLAELRCPFIKRDLLQHNPMGVPYLHHWEPLLATVSDYDSSMIVDHLEYSMRGRVY